jgi:hypothetical protein
MNIGLTSYIQLKTWESTYTHVQNAPLYSKTLSIKPVNHLSSSCKDHPDFSLCLSLQLINCPLNRLGFLCHLVRAHHCLLLCVLLTILSFPFQLNVTTALQSASLLQSAVLLSAAFPVSHHPDVRKILWNPGPSPTELLWGGNFGSKAVDSLWDL